MMTVIVVFNTVWKRENQEDNLTYFSGRIFVTYARCRRVQQAPSQVSDC